VGLSPPFASPLGARQQGFQSDRDSPWPLDATGWGGSCCRPGCVPLTSSLQNSLQEWDLDIDKHLEIVGAGGFCEEGVPMTVLSRIDFHVVDKVDVKFRNLCWKNCNVCAVDVAAGSSCRVSKCHVLEAGGKGIHPSTRVLY